MFTVVLNATVAKIARDQRTSAYKKNLIPKDILPDDFSSQSGEETIWYLRAVGWKNVTFPCVAGRDWDEGLECGFFFELHAR